MHSFTVSHAMFFHRSAGLARARCPTTALWQTMCDRKTQAGLKKYLSLFEWCGKIRETVQARNQADFCNANFKLCAMARCCLCWKKHGVDTNLNESLKKKNMGQKRYSSNLSIPIIFCRMLWRCPLADNRVNIIRVGRCRCVQENRRLCTQCETGIKRVGAIHTARFFLPWRDLTVRCAHFPAVMHIQKVTRKPSAGKRDSCNVQR